MNDLVGLLYQKVFAFQKRVLLTQINYTGEDFVICLFLWYLWYKDDNIWSQKEVEILVLLILVM